MLANAARGEVALKIGSIDLVIAAEMGRLAALSAKLGCDSLTDLWTRITSMEINAVIAGIQTLTVQGDVKAAMAELKLKHFKDCQDAFVAALAFQMEDGEGNADAPQGAAPAVTSSLGPTG